MHRLDAAEAYDCDDKMPCTKFCFAMDKEETALKPHFALDLLNIARTQLNFSCCVLVFNTISSHKNFHHKSASLHDSNKMLRTSDNKVVVPPCLRSRTT